MPTSDQAAQFHLFLQPEFFDAETCARILAEARSAPTTQAPVYIEGSSNPIHETVRKTTSLHLSAETISWVQQRLLQQRSSLEHHFKLSLTDCEKPQFLAYRPGDFFVPHRDGNTDQLEFDHLRIRKISIVIFLNRASTELEAGTFRGGALAFCRDGPPSAPLTFPVWGETGLLIAFTADTLHEVTPVTGGERFTIISWFK